MNAALHPAKTAHPPILQLVKQVQYKAYLRLEGVLQPLGITAVQFRVMTTLQSRPGTSSAELARLYGVKPQTMIKQIGTLQTKGLIERTASEDNKRRLDLRLSERGQEILAQCRTGAMSIENELMAVFSESEQDQLASLLERMLASLGGRFENNVEDFSREVGRRGVQRN